MNRLLNRLLVGGSATALVATAPYFFVSRANAQEAAAAPVEQVEVTGTSIRGTAPVGDNLISVDQTTLQQTAPVSMQQMLNDVPGLSTANGPPQGTSINSFYTPQIHQLAGSVSNSTLTVIDGLRMPGAGGDSLPDPNNIPTYAIERVEVLADGASSVYGSDAVSGVVNFILRKSYDGLLVNAQYGVGNNYGDDTGNLLWGTSWPTGSAMFAAQYTWQSRLAGNSRSFLDMGDYTPLGGNNYDEVYGCPTATMTVPGVSGVFLTPQSTTTVSTALSSRGQSTKDCNITPYGDALPESTRRSALLRVTNDFGSRLSATVTMNYGDLNTEANQEPGQLSGVTVFGPGSGKTGQINPFYQTPAGAPTATQESINWVDLIGNGTGPNQFGTDTVYEENFYATLVATYNVTSNWTASLSDAVGQNEYDTGSLNTFCTSCAILALNGTASSSGSTTATDIPGQNVVALNTPLTTANALDIWNPAGSGNLTQPLVAQSLYKGTTTGRSDNTMNQARLEADGPLFELPAGAVKMAIGGEYQLYHLITDSSGYNGTGPLTNGTQELIFRSRRNVLSAFAELNVPVISQDMGIPLVEKVDIDISGRYDKYSDVGPTANPKYAIDWTISDGYKLRANYSTSFVAPPVDVLGDPSLGGEYSGGASIAPAFNVPVSVFPAVTQLPGCAGVTTSCQLGAGTAAPGLTRQYGGALNGIKPQTGNGWNLGADLAPPFLPGFVANITFFNQEYKGGVTAPNINQITTNEALYKDLILCPGGCSQAVIDAFTRVPEGGTVSGTLPTTIYDLQIHDETNVLNLSIQGIDLTVAYDFDTDWGHFHLGDSDTTFTTFNQNILGGPSFSELGTSGINSTFPSIATQNRATITWSEEAWEVDGWVNYTSGYRNAGNTTVNPIILDANGNYAGGGDVVKSNTTFDTTVAYSFTDGILGGDQIYLNGINVFNTAPPFYNYPNHGSTLSNNGYNPFVSSPIGRIISIGFRAKF